MNAMKRSAGFTLIEVLISVAIFAVGSLAILGMVTTSIDLNKNSREAYEATQLGDWKMDHLQTVPVTDADFTACAAPVRCWQTRTMGRAVSRTTMQTTDMMLQNGTTAQGVSSSVQYQVTWTMDQAPATQIGGKRVTVSVYWPKEKVQQGLVDAAAPDCVGDEGNCHKVVFHTYRDQ
jgi:prepilin-type N-terminal cleavage/methylation domain-containing protein